MDSIGIEATSASSGDIHNLSIPTVIGMLTLVLFLGIISSRRLRGRGLAVHHLFLKISIKRGDETLTGFVRTLDIDEMMIVMAEAPQKGDVLSFDLSSLPGFPAPGQFVSGRVNKIKPIGGNNHNVLVSVTLDLPEADNSVSNTLAEYLRHLHA